MKGYVFLWLECLSVSHTFKRALILVIKYKTGSFSLMSDMQSPTELTVKAPFTDKIQLRIKFKLR